MRYIADYLAEDLRQKMVFVGGPRQCGKTTMAQALLKSSSQRSHVYLNWDDEDDRRTILARRWGGPNQLVVLDELHKFPRWKNWLKGVYDTRALDQQILVTGSARLDVYRRGGDSLLGRYHYWRLHPFCLGELPAKMTPAEGLKRLLTVGGFPEPFTANDERTARRWRRERYERILRDDVRDLESVQKLGMLELFVDALRHRVGSTVVLSNIASDLQVSPHTLSHWLEILERLYLVFVVRPLTKNMTRAIQKAPKVFFFDNMDVIGDDGARFENLIATHLLKRVQLREDRDGYKYMLHYIRDKQGREVDFAITKDHKVDEIIEAKWADDTVSPSLRYYAERLKPNRARQIVGQLRRPYAQGQLEVQNVLEAFSAAELNA